MPTAMFLLCRHQGGGNRRSHSLYRIQAQLPNRCIRACDQEPASGDGTDHALRAVQHEHRRRDAVTCFPERANSLAHRRVVAQDRHVRVGEGTSGECRIPERSEDRTADSFGHVYQSVLLDRSRKSPQHAGRHGGWKFGNYQPSLPVCDLLQASAGCAGCEVLQDTGRRCHRCRRQDRSYIGRRQAFEKRCRVHRLLLHVQQRKAGHRRRHWAGPTTMQISSQYFLAGR